MYTHDHVSLNLAFMLDNAVDPCRITVAMHMFSRNGTVTTSVKVHSFSRTSICMVGQDTIPTKKFSE
jgi:hypothetical protein